VTSELIVDFVNTLELVPYHEGLASSEALSAWLTEQGLAAPGVEASEADLHEAIQVREAIRTLLGAHNELPGDLDAASAVLDAAAKRADLRVCFSGGTVRLEPTTGGACGALGRLLAAVAAAMADESWDRLKACRAEDCRWAFLDTAKNRSRAWCSMESCGNRAKVRAYRARHAHN
jgi:predicted RNA-binding Zn ribbon-like protein